MSARIKVLISKEEIKNRVAELGAQLTIDYAGKELIVVGVLKGSVLFFSDLIRAIELPLGIDFMGLSSYSGTTSTREIIVKKDISVNIQGKHVLIVEDIVDSGHTIKYAKHVLAARNPASIKFVTLLDKPERREVDVMSDYVGFNIPNEFVVGYGLDYNEEYRNLSDICVLELL